MAVDKFTFGLEVPEGHSWVALQNELWLCALYTVFCAQPTMGASMMIPILQTKSWNSQRLISLLKVNIRPVSFQTQGLKIVPIAFSQIQDKSSPGSTAVHSWHTFPVLTCFLPYLEPLHIKALAWAPLVLTFEITREPRITTCQSYVRKCIHHVMYVHYRNLNLF